MIKLYQPNLFFSIFLSLCLLGCKTGKKLETNPVHYSKKGILATIEPLPNNKLRLLLTIENNSNDTFAISKLLPFDEHSFTIQWPDGRQKILGPFEFVGADLTRLLPGEIFTFQLFIAENIANEYIKGDKASHETGTYHILWTNERLGFSTTFNYHYDMNN